MTSPAAPPDLARLDACRPATLDPQVWTSNLAALSAQQPALAAELRPVVLPDTWRPAFALDGFLTFRLEAPGGPPEWLGQTAAPRTRAQALLKEFDAADRNTALPVIGAGAELLHLLARLPAHLAVFVFETDVRALAAVLRIADLAAEIGRGRCIFVPPDSSSGLGAGREIEFLTELLDAHPGLMPPGNILLPDLLSPARIERLRLACEEVGREVGQRRAKRLHELAAGAERAADFSPRGLEAAPRPRLALLSLVPDARTHAIAGCVERAARSLGWDVLLRVTADPRSVHVLAHCDALIRFQPTITLCVNHLRAALPLPPRGRTCAWLLDEAAVPAQLPDDDTLYLAASPRVADALRRAGARADTLLDWFWGCEAGPDDEPAGQPENTVLLIADLPPEQPEAYGVRQPTHKRLWSHLRGIAAKLWQTPTVLETEKVLERGERESGVELRDRVLRDDMLRLIARALVPGVALEQIAAALVGESAQVLVLGRGWERLAGGGAKSNFAPLGGVKVLGGDLFDLPDRGAGLRPLACIFAGQRDPLGPTLLYAAARGWPLVLHCPGSRGLQSARSRGRGSSGGALGDVLRPAQHFEPFSGLPELRRAVHALRDAPQAAAQRAARARRQVREHHSYARRLEELAAVLHYDPGRSNL